MEKEYVYYQRLMDLRKGKRKTITEMAYESELSASTISNYERGVRIPDGKALIKLSKYFNCTTDYLLGLSDYKNDNEVKTLNNILDTINLGLVKIDEVDRETFLRAIQKLIDGYSGLSRYEIMKTGYLVTMASLIDIFESLSVMPEALTRCSEALANEVAPDRELDDLSEEEKLLVLADEFIKGASRFLIFSETECIELIKTYFYTLNEFQKGYSYNSQETISALFKNNFRNMTDALKAFHQKLNDDKGGD